MLNPLQLSGAFLAGSLIIGLVAVAVLAADGAFPGFSALLRGSLEEMAPHVRVFRLTNVLYGVAWVALLVGFILLTRLLVSRGDEQIATLALWAIAVAAVFALLETSFSFTLTAWAVGEAATGAVPEIYTVLRRWVDGIQGTYIVLGLAAQAGFGVSLLKTGLLPSWVGLVTLVWSLIWLPVLGLGIPAVLFIMPALIGISLLLA